MTDDRPYDVSKLIAKLTTVTAHTCDLATLLQNMDIHENITDIITLLTIDRVTDISPILSKIGVERALVICDELCAPAIIRKIIREKIMLTRPSHIQIINLYVADIEEIYNLYRMGYKPIPTIDIDKHYNNDMPTNDNLAALLNDMYTHNLTWLARSTNVYSSNMAESHIKEIQSIKLYNIDTNDITINMISTCTNAISLYCDNYDYQYGSPSEFADSFRNSPIMPRLKHLSARGILEDKCLEFCSNIYEFDAFNNPYITTCDPFARVLRILNASYECGICDIGLIRCTHIRNINVDNNPHITTCAPFAKSLRILSAQFDRCGISDQSLSLCMNLKKNVLRT